MTWFDGSVPSPPCMPLMAGAAELERLLTKGEETIT